MFSSPFSFPYYFAFFGSPLTSIRRRKTKFSPCPSFHQAMQNHWSGLAWPLRSVQHGTRRIHIRLLTRASDQEYSHLPLVPIEPILPVSGANDKETPIVLLPPVPVPRAKHPREPPSSPCSHRTNTLLPVSQASNQENSQLLLTPIVPNIAHLHLILHHPGTPLSRWPLSSILDTTTRLPSDIWDRWENGHPARQYVRWIYLPSARPSLDSQLISLNVLGTSIHRTKRTERGMPA